MALDDNALFTAAVGYVYISPVGTGTKPTPADIAAFDPATGLPGTGWIDLGHTSRDDLPEFGYEGGDTETRGTWRSAALREVITEAAVDYVSLKLHQFDEEGLSLYYGVANGSTVKGEFAVNDAATTTTDRSLCIVMVDGDVNIAFYSRKSGIRRDDSVSLAVDEFSVLPLRATFLKDGVNPLFSWISEDTGINPTGTQSVVTP